MKCLICKQPLVERGFVSWDCVLASVLGIAAVFIGSVAIATIVIVIVGVLTP